jgi:5-formyltetrahydrofolate cyclo-ligase
LCYAERIVPAVPVEAWDVRMDAVVNDREVLRIGAGVARG